MKTISPLAAKTLRKLVAEYIHHVKPNKRSSRIVLGQNRSEVWIHPPIKATENRVSDNDHILGFKKAEKVSKSEKDFW
jgi:hypothetical protein